MRTCIITWLTHLHDWASLVWLHVREHNLSFECEPAIFGPQHQRILHLASQHGVAPVSMVRVGQLQAEGGEKYMQLGYVVHGPHTY